MQRRRRNQFPFRFLVTSWYCIARVPESFSAWGRPRCHGFSTDCPDDSQALIPIRDFASAGPGRSSPRFHGGLGRWTRCHRQCHRGARSVGCPGQTDDEDRWRRCTRLCSPDLGRRKRHDDPAKICGHRRKNRRSHGAGRGPANSTSTFRSYSRRRRSRDRHEPQFKERLFQESRKLVASTRPLAVRVFDEAVKQLEKELELSIVNDVLPAFGDVFTAFDSPAAGGMVATSLVVSLEVRDARKATVVSGFDRLMKLVDQSPGGRTCRNRRF